MVSPSPPLNIAFYYWCPPQLGALLGGGGVAVYLQNLALELVASGHRVSFVYAGVDYTLRNQTPHVKKTQIRLGGQWFDCCSLVNSPVVAPGGVMAKSPQTAIRHGACQELFTQALTMLGALDVVHFHSMEGLAFDALACKASLPSLRFVFSAHNYHAVCPQVNLWQGNANNCTDYLEGQACVSCLANTPTLATSRRKRELLYLASRLGLTRLNGPLKLLMRWLSWRRKARAFTASPQALPITQSPTAARHYANYRQAARDAVQTHCDAILAVSQATKDALVEHGWSADAIAVMPIGTDQIQQPAEPKVQAVDESLIGLAYLGYARADKGFYFFLQAMQQLPAELAARCRLVIGAQISDAPTLGQIKALKTRFGSVVLVNGYERSALPQLLEQVSFGVVPVLWRDNLPQVALEFYANGCAVITSDLGGAKELSQFTGLTFRAGDINEFISVIRSALAAPAAIIEQYFAGGRPLPSIADHSNKLIQLYRQI